MAYMQPSSLDKHLEDGPETSLSEFPNHVKVTVEARFAGGYSCLGFRRRRCPRSVDEDDAEHCACDSCRTPGCGVRTAPLRVSTGGPGVVRVW